MSYGKSDRPSEKPWFSRWEPDGLATSNNQALSMKAQQLRKSWVCGPEMSIGHYSITKIFHVYHGSIWITLYDIYDHGSCRSKYGFVGTYMYIYVSIHPYNMIIFGPSPLFFLTISEKCLPSATVLQEILCVNPSGRHKKLSSLILRNSHGTSHRWYLHKDPMGGNRWLLLHTVAKQ